jgi:hypothetical protein
MLSASSSHVEPQMRAYTIAAMVGGAQGIDRYVLEGLLGHNTSPLIERLIDRGHLVPIGNGTRLVAGKPPKLVSPPAAAA